MKAEGRGVGRIDAAVHSMEPGSPRPKLGAARPETRFAELLEPDQLLLRGGYAADFRVHSVARGLKAIGPIAFPPLAGHRPFHPGGARHALTAR